MALSGRFLQFSSPKVHPPAPLAPFPPAFVAKGPSVGTPGDDSGRFRRRRSIRRHPWRRFRQHSSPKVQPPAPLAPFPAAFVAKGLTLSGFLPQVPEFLCAFSQSRTAFATNLRVLCAFSQSRTAFATNPVFLCAFSQSGAAFATNPRVFVRSAVVRRCGRSESKSRRETKRFPPT